MEHGALLKASNVSHFFGGLCAVSEFNLSLRHGELIGIIGPNGAGKTTLFNIMTGIYRPSEGSITFNGKELIGKTPDRIAAMGIARTFQNIRLFNDLTVLDNIRIAHYSKVKYHPVEALFHIGRFSAEEANIRQNSMQLLALFQLDSFALELSKNLPYGLQRRLEIVRALASDPQILLLDEPAAGINPREIDQLKELIQWIRKEFHLTIILIEHQMRLVMDICERLKVLDFGTTIAEGTPREIQNNAKVLVAYLGRKIVE